MSECINTSADRASFRWQLLSTVSALALLASAYGTSEAKAADDDSDRPAIWIELGGQLSRVDEGQETFAPVFPNSPPRPAIFSPSQEFERPPLYSIGENGKISFQPDGMDWIFSASVLYGRSNSDKHVRQQTHPKDFTKYAFGHLYDFPARGAKFADTVAQNREQHAILDFQAGKDVGLGMFGKGSSSVFNFGVRFAQFATKSNITVQSVPDWRFYYKYSGTKFIANPYRGGLFHSNVARLTASRSFHGIGPSLSWNASAAVAGSPGRGEIALDWGLNAAFLFGRQKAIAHHQATGQYERGGFTASPYRHLTYHHSVTPPARSRFVMVPDVGGFAGATLRWSVAKISLGYRADLFFGAMDGGIDTAKKENVGFYGPFATISVGFP